MGNEFMNLSINANGFSNVQNTAAGHKAEQANKQGKSAFFAGSPVLTTKNQIEQRKKMAQKSALKLVKDAWDNDQAVEKTVASQRQHYAELDAQRTEAKKALAGYEDQEKTLKEQCNVADDSKEQQDLNLLEKRQEYRRGVGEELTRDEWKKLNEIDKQPLTEYQKRALEIHAQAAEEKVTIRDTTSGMQAAVGNVKRIMIEKLKTHGMVDAKNAARGRMPWRVHNQKWFLYFLNRKQNLHRMQILCKSPDLHGVQDVKQINGRRNDCCSRT